MGSTPSTAKPAQPTPPSSCCRTATPARPTPRSNLIAELGTRWRCIAPDLPGFGYSATPSADDFGYTFDAYAEFLHAFVDTLGLKRYVVWLHDYGSQFGLRLAIAKPDRIAGLVIQNGDIYEDAFGPKYDFLKKSWDNPGPDARRRIAQHVTSTAFAASSSANCPMTSPTASAPTCGRCTGR